MLHPTPLALRSTFHNGITTLGPITILKGKAGKRMPSHYSYGDKKKFRPLFRKVDLRGDYLE